MKKVFAIILFVFLTILTQIGGIVYLLSLYLGSKWQKKWRGKTAFIFILIYTITTFGLVPLLAPLGGRERVKHSERIKPTNYITVFLNRNYVRPALNKLLSETEKSLKGTTIELRYLDANFPFFNKFPLLPHLSHHDGKKIDLSLIYKNKKGKITNKQKSRSGYGVFEAPLPHEKDQIKRCFQKGYFQYDYPKYMSLGRINSDLSFSEIGTKKLILNLLKNTTLGKIFIEPHLKKRLGLYHKKIRYHGCRAVRHDDHIHLQLK